MIQQHIHLHWVKNYIEPPNIVVIDRVTGLVKDEVITTVELQGTSVS